MALLVYISSFVFFAILETNAVLIPKHYDLHLVVDPFNKTLSGSVKIKIHAENKTDTIQLLADPSIIIQNATIFPENSTSPNQLTVTKIEKTKPDGLNLYINQKLTKNRTFIVYLKFNGTKPGNSSTNSSIYLVNVIDATSKNLTSYFVIDLTKNNSKAAFPCMFDPSSKVLKTTFNLTIARPKSFKLITISHSNISHIQSMRHPDYYEDAYWQTIPVPIKSFALIATNGSNIYQINRRENGTCPNKTIEFGLNREMLVCMLDQLSIFYGTVMPGNSVSVVIVPKLSNISIEAFSLLTVTSDDLNTTNPYFVLQNLVYQLSSQWIFYRVHSISPSSGAMIGSLKWFAASIIIMPKLVQKSNISEYNNYHDTMLSTYYKFIRYEWDRNQNISECYLVHRNLFVLNMVKEILGTKLFSEGLADLLSKSNHNPIKDDDIWRHLTHIAMKYEAFDVPDYPQSVEEIVKPYLNTSLISIPLLEFDFDFYGSFGGFIRQIPYAFTPSSYDNKLYANFTGSPLWKVPIQLALENEKFSSQLKTFVWAKTRNRAIALTNFSQKEILLLNPGIRGPFIVKYRKNNWDMVFERFESIPLKYRTQLLYDLHVLSHSSHYNYTDYIKYLPKIKPSEKNLPVWNSYMELISDVDEKLFGNSRTLIRKLFVKQLTVIYKKYLNVSKTESRFWIIDFKKSVEKYLCERGEPVCNKTAEFQNVLKEIKSPMSVSSVHLCSAMSNITFEQWNQVAREIFKNYKNYTCNCYKFFVQRLISGCTINKQGLETFLKVMFLNHENASISIQNGKTNVETVQHLLLKIKSSEEGSSVLLEFFIKNFEEIKRKFPDHFRTVLSITTKNQKSEADIKKCIEFLKANSGKFEKEKTIVNDNLLRLEEQLTWTKTVLPEIEKFLTEIFKSPEKFFNY